MEQKPTSGLFEEFPKITAHQWEAKILEDLKGADYQRLIWKTTDGLQLKPYYMEEDLGPLAHLQPTTGFNDFVRKRKEGNNWEICQYVQDKDPGIANRIALDALVKGADAIEFDTRMISSLKDLQTLLQGIDMPATPVYFSSSHFNANLPGWLKAYSPRGLKGSLGFDPLGNFALYQTYGAGRTSIMQIVADSIRAVENDPDMSVIQVNGNYYNNAGATIIQELAIALAQGHEYLYQLSEIGVAGELTAKHIGFTLGIGSDYFLEIARLRAARMLWAKIVDQYHSGSGTSQMMRIHAVTSSSNKTIFDPHVNMLRATTEAMSAALGGADRITVLPFDSSYRKPEEFSERIARNLQQILKHEAYFHKVADVPGGSYYIEKLTDTIAAECWKMFQQIEQNGGFIACVESGYIKQNIEKAAAGKQEEVAQRKRVFVGVNQFPNTLEQMIDKLQPVADTNAIADLKPMRATMQLEAVRLAVENHQKKGFPVPEVFLLTFGNPAMRKARADFSSGFFGVAGYRILNHSGFETCLEGANAAVASRAGIVVFCSSDDEYAAIAPAIAHIKNEAPNTVIVVAGYPKEMLAQLEKDGVQYFIHLRANLFNTLSRFNEIFGIA